MMGGWVDGKGKGMGYRVDETGEGRR